MAFDPDAFLASDGFDPDKFLAEKDKSLSGFGANLWEDVKGTASGLGHLAEGMVEHPIDTTVGVAKNIIPAVIEEGKRVGVGELLTGHPIKAVKKLGEAAYDKPLTTAMTVIPAAGAASKGVSAGLKAMRGAELAEVAANVAKTGAKTGAVEGLEDVVTAGIPKASPKNLLPALKYKGKTFVGEPGDLHADIVMKQLRNEPDLNWDVIDNGYVDKTNNQFLNYRQAGEHIGMEGDTYLEAGGLKKMQQEGAPPTGSTGGAGAPLPTTPIDNFTIAMKIKDKIYKGKPGNIHADIDSVLESQGIDTSQGISGWVDNKTGKFVSNPSMQHHVPEIKDIFGEGFSAEGARWKWGEPPPPGSSSGGGTPPKPPPPGGPPPPGTPPPPGGGKPPPGPDPIKEVRDYISTKYGEQAAKPGRIEGTGRYLQNLSQELGTKDIGLQPRQIASMGEGFQGLEKAEMLVDYAREKGYFQPTLTDVARKAKIKAVVETTGKQVEAVRAIGNTRGAPPLAEIRQQLQTQLTDKFGIDAPREIRKVLQKFDKKALEDPTFSGMSDLATELNKAKTPKKGMSQHPGPTTDAANIVSRLNNDALRAVLNPEEAELYTNALRDFGAHKKLENAVAAAGRRSASARSNQRGLLSGLLQQALDRGGYRFAGNVTHRLGKKMVQTPGKFQTLPQFFEELAHETGDILDDLSEGPPQFAHGGIVEEMDAYLTPRYGGTQ